MSFDIVQKDTNILIEQADDIVKSCSGTNCNTSSETTTKIRNDLNSSALNMAHVTINLLNININTEIAQNIITGYNTLSANISTAYTYQCGAVVPGNTCVNNSLSVQAAQLSLSSTIEPAYNANFENMIILCALASIIIICTMLFFAFFSVGVATIKEI